MKALVTCDSALWYWRNANDFPRTLTRRFDGPISDFEQEGSDLDSIIRESAMFGSLPIHLMSTRASCRPQKNRFVYHICSKPLPSHAFCRASNSILIASPELALAQMAKSKSLPQIAELFMEFAGYYALRQNEKRGFASRRSSLVTRASALKMMTETMGKRSFSRVSSILAYAAEGSRSPMETRQYLLAFLPKRFGGYGLPAAQINAVIELNVADQRKVDRKHIECDLYWPEHGVAIEYDGDIDHASFESRSNDATKRNLLQSQGKRVFTVTARQILDVAAFDTIMYDVAQAIHFRLRDFPADWESRRDRLRNELFESMGRTA